MFISNWLTMNFIWIQTFVTVVDEVCFAQAARKHKISPAAVSKQVANLEAAVGVPLLKRSTRSLTLTESGQLFYKQGLRVLEEVREAQSLALEMREEPYGTLRVFSGSHFARQYIVPAIADFTKLYPKLTLDLHLQERMPDLEKEKVDVLIGMSVSASGDVMQKRILTTRYVYCASPEYFEKNGMVSTPDQLTKLHYITHSMRQPDNILEFPEGKRLHINPTIYVNDAEAMRKMAKDGLGIIKVHDYVVAKDLEDGSLVQCLEGYTKESIPIWVAYRRQKHVAPKVRHFIDYMTELCK